MSDELALAVAVKQLAEALAQHTKLLDVLVCGMKPSTEAKLLGVSTRTVTRRRKARKFERMMS